MADLNKTVQRSKTEDSRRIETHVQESAEGAATNRVTTIKEEIVPMAVTKVVRETIVPVVTSRQVDSYQDGKVVSTAHEVVPDEALQLSEYEERITKKDITKAVEDALKRNKIYASASIIPDTPSQPTKPAMEINYELLLYVALAIEAAAIVYVTVLKGWLLN